jgi:hypothetical protein
MAASQSSRQNVGRLRLWEMFAWFIAVLIFATTWVPAPETRWPQPAILVLLLLLASEWLVLKRTDHHQHACEHKRNAVRLITSLLLTISAIMLAISSTRR